MILGVGIDLVAVERFDAKRGEAELRLLEEIFTEEELSYCRRMHRPAAFFAVRFAAKEALFKALGTGKRGGMSWRDAEVVHGASEEPSLRLAGETRAVADGMGVSKIHLSLTHTDQTAAAVVVLED